MIHYDKNEIFSLLYELNLCKNNGFNNYKIQLFEMLITCFTNWTLTIGKKNQFFLPKRKRWNTYFSRSTSPWCSLAAKRTTQQQYSSLCEEGLAQECLIYICTNVHPSPPQTTTATALHYPYNATTLTALPSNCKSRLLSAHSFMSF